MSSRLPRFIEAQREAANIATRLSAAPRRPPPSRRGMKDSVFCPSAAPGPWCCISMMSVGDGQRARPQCLACWPRWMRSCYGGQASRTEEPASATGRATAVMAVCWLSGNRHAACRWCESRAFGHEVLLFHGSVEIPATPRLRRVTGSHVAVPK